MLMKKMKDDISNVMSVGKMKVDWAVVVLNDSSRVSLRWTYGYPSNLWMDEIPNPVYLMNPFNLFDKLKLFHKAFFTDDPVGKGKKKDKDGNVEPSISGSSDEGSIEELETETVTNRRGREVKKPKC